MTALDPARVTHAAEALLPGSFFNSDRELVADVLAADDARAREAGLICAADGLTVEALADLVEMADTYGAMRAFDDLSPALRERIKEA